MVAVLSRCGRMWATILVVYALLLGGLAPALAASLGQVPSGEICASLRDGDHGAPRDAAHHGAACCILCHAAATPAAPATATAVPVPPRPAAPVSAAISGTSRPRGPPGAAPQSPRAPPAA